METQIETTYRDAIQQYIAVIEKLYDLAGALRDAATSEEKQPWNDARRITRDLSTVMQRLDNRMTNARGNDSLGNWKFPIVIQSR